MEYIKLTTALEIDAYTDELKKSGRTIIALDFEGEFNLHVYGEKLCLIQIYDNKNAVIIDPLQADLGAVKRLLEDEKILKIMWDAQSDISLVVNGYSMMIKSVLDLRPSADLLELSKKDYSSVISELLGVDTKIDKSRFQKYNWLKRPIDDEAINYGINDVLHLHGLKDVVLKKLFDSGKLDEYIRLNMIIQNRNYVRLPGQRHKKLKGYRYLDTTEQILLKKLFELRDDFAQKLNWPPNRVIPNPDLMELSKGCIRPERIYFDRKIRKSVEDDIIKGVRKLLD